jgi:hypothetical protein
MKDRIVARIGRKVMEAIMAASASDNFCTVFISRARKIATC